MAFVGRLLRWCALASLIATAMYEFVYLASRALIGLERGIPVFRLVFILCIMVITAPAALWILVVVAVKGIVRAHMPEPAADWINAAHHHTDKFVHNVASWLFGLGEKKIKSVASQESDTAKVDQEWMGRLNYIRVFERKVDQSNETLQSEILALEKRLYEHDEIMRRTQDEEAHS